MSCAFGVWCDVLPLGYELICGYHRGMIVFEWVVMCLRWGMVCVECVVCKRNVFYVPSLTYLKTLEFCNNIC